MIALSYKNNENCRSNEYRRNNESCRSNECCRRRILRLSLLDCRKNMIPFLSLWYNSQGAPSEVFSCFRTSQSYRLFFLKSALHTPILWCELGLRNKNDEIGCVFLDFQGKFYNVLRRTFMKKSTQSKNNSAPFWIIGCINLFECKFYFLLFNFC